MFALSQFFSTMMLPLVCLFVALVGSQSDDPEWQIAVIDFPPFIQHSNSTFSGFSVDLVNLLGLQIGFRPNFKLVGTGVDQLLQGLWKKSEKGISKFFFHFLLFLYCNFISLRCVSFL